MLRLITQSQQNPILSYPFSNVLYSQMSLGNGSPRILILYSGLLLEDLIAGLLCLVLLLGDGAEMVDLVREGTQVVGLREVVAPPLPGLQRSKYHRSRGLRPWLLTAAALRLDSEHVNV